MKINPIYFLSDTLPEGLSSGWRGWITGSGLVSSLIIAGAALLASVANSSAANYVMSGNDAVGVASFNSGANWMGGAAPVAGNTYQTAAFLLRTPANASSITFAGDSLEIQAGGDLRSKTGAAISINQLLLDSGGIFDISADGGSLAGNIKLSSGMTYLSVGGGETFTCSATVTGSGGFYTYNSVSTGAGTLILSAVNTFQGGIEVNGGTLEVNATGNGSTPLGGLSNNPSTNGAANVTIDTGSTLVALAADAFGYYPNTAPGILFINGGTVTDVGTSSYRITLPNLIFNGGTLTSAAGNYGDNNGNYSLFGNGAPTTIITLSNNQTAVISAGTISLQQAGQATGTTIFKVAAGYVAGGATPGVDLLVSSAISDWSGSSGAILKSGSGVMTLTGDNTYSGGTTIAAGTLQIGTSGDTDPLTDKH